MTPNEITLKDVAERLDELVAWQRFESLPKLRTILLKELDSDNKKLAYEMTDGEKSRRDIASALGVSDDNIQNWWQRWYELAVVRPSKKFKGRPQHIVSLEDVGIKLPKAAPTKKEAKEAEIVAAEQPSESAQNLSEEKEKDNESKKTEEVKNE